MNEEKPQYPSEVIDLPSEGKLYPSDNPLSSGKIELKYPTAREEDILTSKNLITKGTVLETFIEALIVDKNIDINTMFLGDKNALIVAARILAYGPEYGVEISCPKCEAKNEEKIMLNELETKEIDFSGVQQGVNEFEFQLPASKLNITYRLLTSGDEKAIDAEFKAMKKYTKGSGQDQEITTRLKYSVLAVNGDTDRMKIKKFVDSMLSIDALAFRKQLSKNTPDVDMKYNYTCPECNYTERMIVPLGISFFWPSGNV